MRTSHINEYLGEQLYEPLKSEPVDGPAEPRHISSPTTSPYGRDRTRGSTTRHESGDEPKQFRRASDAIAHTLADAAAGRASRQHPELDVIFGRQRASGYGPGARTTTATQPAGRGASGFGYERHDQSSGSTPAQVPISDVFTDRSEYIGFAERMAIVEHRAQELDRRFDEHKNESIRAGASFATKQDIIELDNRLDREVVPQIRDIRQDLKNNQFKQALVTISLIVSIIYSVIITYRNFMHQ